MSSRNRKWFCKAGQIARKSTQKKLDWRVSWTGLSSARDTSCCALAPPSTNEFIWAWGTGETGRVDDADESENEAIDADESEDEALGADAAGTGDCDNDKAAKSGNSTTDDEDSVDEDSVGKDSADGASANDKVPGKSTVDDDSVDKFSVDNDSADGKVPGKSRLDADTADGKVADEDTADGGNKSKFGKRASPW